MTSLRQSLIRATVSVVLSKLAARRLVVLLAGVIDQEVGRMVEQHEVLKALISLDPSAHIHRSDSGTRSMRKTLITSGARQ